MSPRIIFAGFVSLFLVIGCSSPEERAAEYLERAQALFEAGEYSIAALEASNAAQIEPKNVAARWLLARIAEADGRPGDAFQHLSVVIMEDESNYEARIMMAKLMLASQQSQGIDVMVQEAMEFAPPDDSEVILLQARLSLREENPVEAVKYLDLVLEKEPANIEASVLRALVLGASEPERALAGLNAAIEQLDPITAKPLRQTRVDLLSLQGRNDDVEQALLDLQRDFPGDIAVLRNLERFYVGQNRPEDALNVLQKAVKQNPDDSQAKFALLQYQSRSMRNPEQTEQDLLKFVEDEPDNMELHVMLGTFYEAQDRFDDALETYSFAAEREPRSDAGLAASNRIAAIRVQRDDLGGAREKLDELLELMPNNVTALTMRGEINLAEGQLDEAVADLRVALRNDEENKIALLALARTHRARGEGALAEEVYRSLLLNEPGQVDALAELAFEMQSRGRPEEAEEFYARLLAIQPGNAIAMSGLAEISLVAGDLDTAEQYARELIASDDSSGIGYIQLGKVLQARENFEGAADAFEAALSKDSESAIALRGVTGSLTIIGQLDRAGQLLESFLAANAENTEALTLLGGNQLRRGQTERARDTLEQVAKLDPERVQSYILLASSYPDDADKRAETFRRGLAAVPGQPDLAVLLASQLSSMGDFDGAIETYEQARADAEFDNPRVANNLAALLLDHRSDEESHRRALELVQPYVDSGDPIALDTIGWAYYRQRDYRRAVQYLEMTAASGRNVPVVHYHLGKAYAANNDNVNARMQLEKAKQLADEQNAAEISEKASAALQEIEAAASST